MAGQENTEAELRTFAERIERLRDEKKPKSKEYDEDIKQVWAEIKGRGHDKKALDAVLRLRAIDNETREMVNIYADRLGVFG